MSVKKLNEAFKRMYESAITEAVSPYDLRRALESAVDNLSARGEGNIKAYEIAFQDVIESFYPDKAWWEVCGLDIFNHLFTERDPELTIEAIVDNMKADLPVEEAVDAIQENNSYSYNGHVIVNDAKAGNWFIKDKEGTFSTDTDAEEFIDNSLSEAMDAFYGNLCSAMDTDNETMYRLYKEGNTSPAQALIDLGYQEVDDHWLTKSVEHDGHKYEQVFDFSDFDYGDTDTYEYYVLRDGEVPSGWTSTISTLDEWLSESLDGLVGTLNEAEMSDEDKHDSDIIRGMIAKMQNRSNAAFTPEEKAIMTKYGITRDNYNKQLTVADRTLNPGLDNDARQFSWSDNNYSNGTPSKINYADRARKLPLRKGNQVAGDGSRHFYQNAHFNRHGKYSGNLQDKERDFQAARMQEPMNNMSMALRRRDSAQRSIDNADAERDRRMAAAQAVYDKAKKDADWHYDYDTVTSKQYRDGAQIEIDKLLKRSKKESLQESMREVENEISQALIARDLTLSPEYDDLESIAQYIDMARHHIPEYDVNTWIDDTLSNYPEYFVR